jgi:hypothetical protein
MPKRKTEVKIGTTGYERCHVGGKKTRRRRMRKGWREIKEGKNIKEEKWMYSGQGG